MANEEIFGGASFDLRTDTITKEDSIILLLAGKHKAISDLDQDHLLPSPLQSESKPTRLEEALVPSWKMSSLKVVASSKQRALTGRAV
jgi:hypothetical protein